MRGVPLICPRCGHAWLYRGIADRSTGYCRCYLCGYNFRIKEGEVTLDQYLAHIRETIADGSPR